MATVWRSPSIGSGTVEAERDMQVADLLLKFRKDDVLIGDDGTWVVTADSVYPEWAYTDRIFLATLEDARRRAAELN
jgi:hypothetical protein